MKYKIEEIIVRDGETNLEPAYEITVLEGGINKGKCKKLICYGINYGTVEEEGRFRDNSINHGTIKGDGNFFNNSINKGTIKGESYFTESSTNEKKKLDTEERNFRIAEILHYIVFAVLCAILGYYVIKIDRLLCSIN